MPLAVGDLAPDFALPAHDGSTVRLSDLRGQRVILWFYPEAMSPGCTQQACGFRDAIEPLGTQVTAGGMPDRVKCLHVHVAHALAAGPGVNPFGDETLAELGDWWTAGPCVPPPT